MTGGILVFLIGYRMLQGRSSRMHTAKESDDTDIAVSPLAVPLLAGPGTIATAMNFSATGTWTEISVTVSMFLALCIISYVCFVFSSKIIELLGESMLGIVSRLMGLILAVVGMQMLILGVKTAAGLS
jgi:multiple antibiotic resistance protein